MYKFRIHSVDSAPEKSKAPLNELVETFGFLPNIAGAMAESQTLLNAFVRVFQKVHSGTFTEAQLQVLLLTNAETNSSLWPVAFHSMLALKAGVLPDDVQAIRRRHLPKDATLAALSSLARAMIEHRGKVTEQELEVFRTAGFAQDQVLEVILVIAASTMTNYSASITLPALEPPFQAQAWDPGLP